MTPVAWQPADGVLQVLLLGRRLGSATLLADALAPHGRFAVQACTTPADAAARLAAEPWDCVVADVAGGADRAADLTAAVAAVRRGSAGVPVIALGDLGRVTAAEELCADDHVARLGDGELLARVIRHAVERHRTQSALATSALHDAL